MTMWSKDELRKIADADELDIAPLSEDGVKYREPTTIWSVAADGALFVRSYKGSNGRWYQSAMRQKAGKIRAGGLTKEVTFEPIGDGPLNDRVDDAYRAK